MTERCWEELRRAGKEIAERPKALREIVKIAAVYFELSRSPDAEAVEVFLDGLRDALEDEGLIAELVNGALARRKLEQPPEAVQ